MSTLRSNLHLKQIKPRRHSFSYLIYIHCTSSGETLGAQAAHPSVRREPADARRLPGHGGAAAGRRGHGERGQRAPRPR